MCYIYVRPSGEWNVHILPLREPLGDIYAVSQCTDPVIEIYANFRRKFSEMEITLLAILPCCCYCNMTYVVMICFWLFISLPCLSMFNSYYYFRFVCIFFVWLNQCLYYHLLLSHGEKREILNIWYFHCQVLILSLLVMTSAWVIHHESYSTT